MNDPGENRHLVQGKPGESAKSPDRQTDPDDDLELQAVLFQWNLPEPSPELDQRVFAAYRRRNPSMPPWKRWIFCSIRVPLPVVALLLLAFIFLGSRAMRSPGLVPVIREKIVTRNAQRESEEQGSERSPISKRGTLVNHSQDLERLSRERSQIASLPPGFEPVKEIRLRVLRAERGIR